MEGAMGYRWPADTAFTRRVLTVEDEACSVCGRRLHVCDHRFHHIFTFGGPVEVVCKLAHCPAADCPAHTRSLSPLAEAQLTLPRWVIGWDVFCWLGHRRFARHWSVPQLRAELRDSYAIALSEDALADYLRLYQTMVAARHQDAALLAETYRDIPDLVLTIDGLQPEKGHETLYVVRELRGKRVWFAEALLSSGAEEVRRLVAKARQWAAQLGKPVALWMSDKQDAFLKAVAAECEGVPHRYCQNHFLRDVAAEVLEADSHAKVQMRSKVRGLRAVERQALAAAHATAAPAPVVAGLAPAAPTAEGAAAAAVVLDYCAAVRGILNDDQGGPLQPPGLRLAEALTEVRASLQRNLDAKQGGARRSNGAGWPAVSTGACRRWRTSSNRSGSTWRRSGRSPRPWTPAAAAARSGGSASTRCNNAWRPAATRCGSRWRSS
jgi:hypothetical protein